MLYKDRTKLPLWRYTLRQRLIALVRWETPRLAAIQKAVRSPALDTYFSITANLGTHTFFMVGLPIVFWCGCTYLARAYGFRNGSDSEKGAKQNLIQIGTCPCIWSDLHRLLEGYSVSAQTVVTAFETNYHVTLSGA